MNAITISTLAPSMSGYTDLATKYAYLIELVELAAREGAELVCLPELSNSLTGLLPPEADRGTLDEMLDAGPRSINAIVGQ